MMYTFTAALERHSVGVERKMWYHVLFMPTALCKKLGLPRQPPLRVQGAIDGVSVEGAWIPAGGGRHYFIVSPKVRKTLQAELGQTLSMQFREIDPNWVDTPQALLDIFSEDPEVAQAWQQLTAGKQRGHVHLLNAAKTQATLSKRLNALCQALLSPPAPIACKTARGSLR